MSRTSKHRREAFMGSLSVGEGQDLQRKEKKHKTLLHQKQQSRTEQNLNWFQWLFAPLHFGGSQDLQRQIQRQQRHAELLQHSKTNSNTWNWILRIEMLSILISLCIPFVLIFAPDKTECGPLKRSQNIILFSPTIILIVITVFRLVTNKSTIMRLINLVLLLLLIGVCIVLITLNIKASSNQCNENVLKHIHYIGDLVIKINVFLACTAFFSAFQESIWLLVTSNSPFRYF